MLLIVGLGNPGKEYEETRHNTGRIVLDYILGDKIEWKQTKNHYILLKECGIS